jgi:hypothetical protein
MRLLWSQSMQRAAFQVFHCTTLMTMFVKTYVARPLWLLDQKYKLVPRILFVWYYRLYRFFWGIRSEPRYAQWTCHTYIDNKPIRQKYDVAFLHDMIRTPSEFILKELYSCDDHIEVIYSLPVDPIVITKCNDKSYVVKFYDNIKISEQNVI